MPENVSAPRAWGYSKSSLTQRQAQGQERQSKASLGGHMCPLDKSGILGQHVLNVTQQTGRAGTSSGTGRTCCPPFVLLCVAVNK